LQRSRVDRGPPAIGVRPVENQRAWIELRKTCRPADRAGNDHHVGRPTAAEIHCIGPAGPIAAERHPRVADDVKEWSSRKRLREVHGIGYLNASIRALQRAKTSGSSRRDNDRTRAERIAAIEVKNAGEGRHIRKAYLCSPRVRI